MADNYNKIITTLNSVSSNYTFIPEQDNVIVIDTSNNRIGINTVNPEHAIDVCGGTIKTKDLIIDNSASIYEGSFNRISSNLIPNVDNVHSLGDASNQWHSLFVGPGSIYLNKDKFISLSGDKLVIDFNGTIQFPKNVEFKEVSLPDTGVAINDANIAGGYIYNTQIGKTSSGNLARDAGHFTDVNVQNLTVSLNTVLQGRLDALDASFANIDVSKNLNVLQDLVVSGRNISDSLNIVDNSINLLNTYVTDVVDNSINNLLISNFDASFANVDMSGDLTVIGDITGGNILTVASISTKSMELLNTTTTKTVTIEPSDSTSVNYTLTLPDDDGDAEQVLQTNGSGVLSWIAKDSGPQGIQGIQGIQGVQGVPGPGANQDLDTTSNVIFSNITVDKITCNSIHSAILSNTYIEFVQHGGGQAGGSVKVKGKDGAGVQRHGSIRVDDGITERSPSDDRLKHNEVDIVNGLDLIRQLVPQHYQKTYDLKDADYIGDLSDGTWKWESGFIAQEVLQIADLSYCVEGGDYIDESGNIVPAPHTLNYNNIFTYACAGLKELDQVVQTQAATITNLQQENVTMKSALNELLAAAGKPTI